MPRRKTHKRDQYLVDTRPRTAARLLNVTRRQAVELIRLEKRWLFDDVIAVLPCGLGMRDATFQALARMKGAQREDI